MPVKPFTERMDAGWTKINEISHAIVSGKFGAVWHVDQVGSDEKILYDQILRLENPGSVFLPVARDWVSKTGELNPDYAKNKDGSLITYRNHDVESVFGLQSVLRPQAEDQDTFNGLVHEYFKLVSKLQDGDTSITPRQLQNRIAEICRLLGRVSHEIPRGFAKPDQDPTGRATDEVRQQTGSTVKRIWKIGSMNDNNAQTGQMTDVFAGEIDTNTSPEHDGRLDERQKRKLSGLQGHTKGQIDDMSA